MKKKEKVGNPKNPSKSDIELRNNIKSKINYDYSSDSNKGIDKLIPKGSQLQPRKKRRRWIFNIPTRIYILILIILIGLVILNIKTCNNAYEPYIATNSYAKDGFRVNKHHYIYNKKQFLEILKQDSIIKALNLKNKELKDIIAYTSTSTNTIIKYVDRVKVVYINNDSLPTYMHTYSDEWICSDVTMNKDSINLQLELTNKYAILYEEVKTGLFKSESIVKVKSLNPYTTVEDVQSIEYKKLPKRFGIGFNCGYGITKDGLSPYVGVGINFNLLKF